MSTTCSCPHAARVCNGAKGRYVVFGDCDYTVTALSIELNRDTAQGDVLDLTYEVPEHRARASVPEMDSTIDMLPGVTLAKAVLTPGVGGMTSVKLTYSRPMADKDSDAEDGGSGSGSSDEDEEEKISNFHSTLDVSVTDEPLLCHPKFSKISDAKMEYYKAYMDGARSWELVTVVENNGKPKVDKDGMPVKKALGKLINMDSELAKLIKKGVTTYKEITATYTTTYTTRSRGVDTSGIGKIDTPIRAPQFPNRNWMLVTRMVTLNDDGKSYTVESSWLLSGLGGWNTYLYGL